MQYDLGFSTSSNPGDSVTVLSLTEPQLELNIFFAQKKIFEHERKEVFKYTTQTITSRIIIIAIIMVTIVNLVGISITIEAITITIFGIIIIIEAITIIIIDAITITIGIIFTDIFLYCRGNRISVIIGTSRETNFCQP